MQTGAIGCREYRTAARINDVRPKNKRGGGRNPCHETGGPSR